MSEVIKSIEEAVTKKYDVVVWYLFHSYTIKGNAKIRMYHPGKSEILIEPQGGGSEVMEQVISGFGTVNVYIPLLSLVFSAPFKNLNERKALTLGMPDTYLYYDRRTRDRVFLEENYNVEFTVGKRECRKRLHDISPGGMSIIFSKSERFAIEPGTKIKNVKLTGDHKTIEVDVVIVNYLKLSPYMLEACPYGGAKVSFRFADLDESTSKVIRQIMNKQLKAQNN